MELDIQVKQGAVHINSITILRQEDNLLYLSIDCREKYSVSDGALYNENDLTLLVVPPDDDGGWSTRVIVKGTYLALCFFGPIAAACTLTGGALVYGANDWVVAIAFFMSCMGSLALTGFLSSLPFLLEDRQRNKLHCDEAQALEANSQPYR